MRPIPVVTLALLLLPAAWARAACTGTPPPAKAPTYVYGYKECSVVEYTINVRREPPKPKTIPLKSITNTCPNCKSSGLVCSVQLGASDTKTIETTIAAQVGVEGFELGVSFSYSLSYTAEATAGCQVEAPKCAVTVVAQDLVAKVDYQRTAKERFEYENCNFFRNDGTFLGGTTGPAVSCGFEDEKVSGTATVSATCKAPEHNKWSCPDPKCPECCPADEKGSHLPNPSFERGGAAILVAATAFPGGTLTGYVLNAEDRPVADAPVALGGDGSLTGTVYTDDQGRFEVAVPAGQKTIEFAVAALAVTALSQVGAEPERALESAFANEFVQPGEVVPLPGDYSRARLEQGPVLVDLPVARSVSRDGQQVVSAVLVGRELRPGPAKVSLTDARGASYDYPTSVFEVTSATLEQENLRAGQSAGFGWQFAVGSEHAGEVVTACAAVQGPVKVEGPACADATVDAGGRCGFSGRVRALPGFAGAFTIRPLLGKKPR